MNIFFFANVHLKEEVVYCLFWVTGNKSAINQGSLQFFLVKSGALKVKVGGREKSKRKSNKCGIYCLLRKICICKNIYESIAFAWNRQLSLWNRIEIGFNWAILHLMQMLMPNLILRFSQNSFVSLILK